MYQLTARPSLPADEVTKDSRPSRWSSQRNSSGIPEVQEVRRRKRPAVQPLPRRVTVLAECAIDHAIPKSRNCSIQSHVERHVRLSWS
jgi:hypothetical protein